MLQDRARIWVQAGAGGNGSVSFRREAHVPRGGPDGGDGGRGADVVVVCDGSLRDLQVFRRRGHWKAERGGHGEGSNRHGASPSALEVRVPPGTVVEDKERGIRWDFIAPGQRAVVARGGSGGRGNKQFTTPTRQAPRFAEKGVSGEEGWLDLRLKLIADVGLIGLPNAGKSSLIARLTRAAPKIADYPFTTLEPVLGTLDTGDRQLVIADIPGLIEGASEGAGLGHEFLAHVERTRLLVHVLDLAPVDGSDPEANFETIENELRSYGAGLAELPRILALSKTDLVEPDVAAKARAAWVRRLGVAASAGHAAHAGHDASAGVDPSAGDEAFAASRFLAVVVTSSATGAGLDDLARVIARTAPDMAEVAADQREALAEHRVYRPGEDEGYRIERGPDGVFHVSGRGIERLIQRHDLENEESLRYIEERLRRIGVIRSLEAQGFEPGDDVEIGGVVFELDPGMPFA